MSDSDIAEARAILQKEFGTPLFRPAITVSEAFLLGLSVGKKYGYKDGLKKGKSIGSHQAYNHFSKVKKKGDRNVKDYKELTGRRFGMLVVKEVLDRERGPNGRLKPAMAVCQCDCGTTKKIKCVSLECKNVQSCGCQRGNTHGKGGRLPSGRVVKYHSCPSPEEGCTYATVLKICCHECPRKDECKRWACENTPDKCGAVYMVAAPEVRDFLTKEGGNINDQKLFKKDRVAHSGTCLN